MIPIKGYATFDPLKICLIGRNFSGDFFKKNIKDPKVSDPLRRIADETEEDYQALEKILKDANVQTHRVDFDENKFNKDWHGRPPVCPRDHFAVIGEKFYAYQMTTCFPLTRALCPAPPPKPMAPTFSSTNLAMPPS